ncbi:flavodoxin family protein [Candidatus Poriferisodalis sp.]|uniref:flavodoxin family protein n=1 Tax=Candidatus Poriferisodalis sp. TaxID=3101277 RepID=UPI003B5921A1
MNDTGDLPDDLPDFSGLRALFINCSIKHDPAQSHTRRLINRAAGVMRDRGVDVEIVHALSHTIAFGMEKDQTVNGMADDWPQIHAKIMEADIFVIGTPIWLGVKSSVATLVVERMYAYSGDRNAKGQYLYYGKTAGCIITGNEDGAKACAMDLLYAMSHIGYTVPPQADCAWLGEAGPGPSYGDPRADGGHEGYDNDFTNRNTTFMSWNLMHTAKMLRDNDGLPAIGNLPETWQQLPNAKDQDPEAD